MPRLRTVSTYDVEELDEEAERLQLQRRQELIATARQWATPTPRTPAAAPSAAASDAAAAAVAEGRSWAAPRQPSRSHGRLPLRRQRPPALVLPEPEPEPNLEVKLSPGPDGAGWGYQDDVGHHLLHEEDTHTSLAADNQERTTAAATAIGAGFGARKGLMSVKKIATATAALRLLARPRNTTLQNPPTLRENIINLKCIISADVDVHGHPGEIQTLNGSYQNVDVYRLISTVPEFKQIGLDDRMELAKSLKVVRAARDQPIVVVGDVGRSMYFLVHGNCAAEVEINGALKVVKHYQKGDYFGELALISADGEAWDGNRRTATVRAVGSEGAVCLELPADVYLDISGKYKSGDSSNSGGHARMSNYTFSGQSSYLIKQLEVFRTSGKSELTIKDTSRTDRSTAHRWISNHEDEEVRNWGHVSRTFRRQRILQIKRHKERWDLDLHRWLMTEKRAHEVMGADVDEDATRVQFSWVLCIKTNDVNRNKTKTQRVVVFEDYDENDDGYLDADELSKICEHLGISCPDRYGVTPMNDPGMPRITLEDISRDKQGCVTFAELHSWWYYPEGSGGKAQSRVGDRVLLTSRFSDLYEAHHLATRLWDKGLSVAHEVSQSGKHLFIKVGASETVLKDEAELMALPMRLTHTKGHMAFKKDLVDHFAVAPDGTRFNSAQRQQIVLHLMDRGLVVPTKTRMNLESAQVLIRRFKKRIQSRQNIRAEMLTEVLTACGAYRSDCAEVFNHKEIVDVESGEYITVSSTRKAATLTEWDHFITVEYASAPEENSPRKRPLGSPRSSDAPSTPGSMVGDALDATLGAVGQVADAALDAADLVRKQALEQSKVALKRGTKLIALGSSFAKSIVGLEQGSKLASNRDMQKLKEKRYRERKQEMLTWKDILYILRELEQWESERGHVEIFTQTLVDVFPLHCAAELKFFQSTWSSLTPISCRPVSLRCCTCRYPKVMLAVSGKDFEGKGTREGYYTNTQTRFKPHDLDWISQHISSLQPSKVVHSAGDSWDSDALAYSVPPVPEYGETDPTRWHNQPKRQWTYQYQPIDEIRDYFGDDVGLYFRWLGLYVNSLVTPSVAGVVCESNSPPKIWEVTSSAEKVWGFVALWAPIAA
eukprot:COSAG01_NODE_2092_length_8449_cov_36.532934_3_plen_1115_part_00